jgi:DNA-binding transcriptional ArsR family regulator
MSKRLESVIPDVDQLSGLFRLLSDSTRLSILLLLTDGERNVSNLCDLLSLPQPTVSHHLGLMRMNNLIASRRDGKQVYYALNGRVGITERGGSLQIGVDHFEVKINPRD